jgi:uncharacterized NAD(P)/FAD-binding protein YdhS
MSEKSELFDVAIIGAGFSGSMVAVHLARMAPNLRVLIADEDRAIGRGVAYGTNRLQHLLNVPAGKMSAFPDAPDDFAEWLVARRRAFQNVWIEAISPDDFLPRRIYGTYIRQLLEKARGATGNLEFLRSQVSDIEPWGDLLHVTAENGTAFSARRIVLALGNFPPGDPYVQDSSFHRSPRYLSDPWSQETLRRISRDDDILILGSGLTALDLLVSLDGIKSQGTIHVISRRGLFPQPHVRYEPQPGWFADRAFPTTIRALVRLVRVEVIKAGEKGIDWRAIIDALRPHNQRIWHLLPLPERRRFMRHLRALWESHRHRAAPDVLSVKDAMLGRSQLLLHRGRVRSIVDTNPGLEVTFLDRSTMRDRTVRVAYAVNCTGPECNYQKLKSPLVVNLLARGLIRPDPLFIGLDTAPGGAVIDYLDAPSANIFTLGSTAKGRLFETTAVPELRVQARELAMRLCEDLSGATRGDSAHQYQI